jgi:hypothetical protein
MSWSGFHRRRDLVPQVRFVGEARSPKGESQPAPASGSVHFTIDFNDREETGKSVLSRIMNKR